MSEPAVPVTAKQHRTRARELAIGATLRINQLATEGLHLANQLSIELMSVQAQAQLSTTYAILGGAVPEDGDIPDDPAA